VLDKNPQHILHNNFEEIRNEFSIRGPNIILCPNPFVKSEFLKKLANSMEFPVIFLDFDLLYAGYVKSGLIKKNENVSIFVSNRDTWQRDLKEIIKKISTERTLVILDSLNGIYNMFDELESTRFINSAIMLLSSVARETNSMMVVAAMATKNDKGELILSPGGRHLLESKKSAMYSLDFSETGLILDSIDKKQDHGKSFEIME
jgi:hypothetical protein